MNNRERMVNTILGREVDRAPYTMYQGVWTETQERWQQEGLSGDFMQICGFDAGIRSATDGTEGTMRLGLWPPFEYEVIAETERTLTFRDGSGIVQETIKGQACFPRFLRHPVETRGDWEQIKAERYDASNRERIPDGFQGVCKALNEGDWMVQLGDYPCGLFGALRDLMGVENCLLAFYDEPELVRDIMNHMVDHWIALYERAICDFGLKVDVVHIWEDMSGVNGPLISPAMVEEFMLPGYRRIKAFCNDHGIPIMSVDTDGNVEKLIPPFLSAGVNFLWPFEVAAGNDVADVLRRYPTLAAMGGIDKRNVALGADGIEIEMARVRRMLQVGRYVPALDHAAHPEISWPDFQLFCARLRQVIGME